MQLNDAMDSQLIHLQTHLLLRILQHHHHRRMQTFVVKSVVTCPSMVNPQYNPSSHCPSAYQVFVEVVGMRIWDRMFVLMTRMREGWYSSDSLIYHPSYLYSSGWVKQTEMVNPSTSLEGDDLIDYPLLILILRMMMLTWWWRRWW